MIQNKSGQKPKPVRCYDLEGNMLEDYPSLREAANQLKLKEGVISLCANGGNYAVSYQFRFLKQSTPLKIGTVANLSNGGKASIPIAKYWKGKLICVYNDMTEASEKNKLSNGNISMSKKGSGIIKGFEFKPIC